MSKIVTNCPICKGKMVAATLKCPNCDIEIKGEFDIESEITAEKRLFSDEDLVFVKSFIKNKGSLKKTGEELGFDYHKVKDILKELNKKLGNEVKEVMKNVSYVNPEGKGAASQKIISMLNAHNGQAACSMLRGNDMRIWLNENGVIPEGFPALICKWEVFDAIVEKARQLGGKMYRGDGEAQRGERIGSDHFSLNTIDAFISVNFYGSHIGDTTLRRSTYYAAILKWAGICDNCRSDGNGGYIRLLAEWK